MNLPIKNPEKAIATGKGTGVIEFLRKTGKKHRKKIIVLIVLLFSVAGYTAFRFNRQGDTTANQNVAEAEVVRGPIEVTVTGTGTIEPVDNEEITPKVAGTVKKIYVKNGDRVKKGDTLIELESDSLRLDIEKARLDVEKARLSLEDSSGQLTADTITAPFAGKIISLEAKAGDDVAKNAVLATLQNDGQLVFDMPVDTTVAGKVALGQKVEVFLPDRGDIVEGKVLAKANQSVSGYNSENRTYLKIAIPAKGNLTSGTKVFGTVTVDGQEVDALSVSTLELVGETQLKATLTGKLTGVYVQEGQVVQQGQKLFSLKSDTALSQQKSQQLSYQQAKLTLTDLESQLRDLTIKAPIDGIISGLDLSEGDEVSASGVTKSGQSQSTAGSSTTSTGSALGKIINADKMKVAFPVDEVDIAKVKLGQKAEVTIDALPDKVFQGQVSEIAEEGVVTNNVSSFDVTILLDNPEHVLKSGMTANVTIMVARKDNALLIPIEALQERGNRKFVLLPAAGDAQQRRNFQRVSVGLTNDTYAEITEGLQEGDKVLLPNQQSNATRQNAMFPPMGGPPPDGGGARRYFTGGNSSGSNRFRTGQ